MSAAAQDTSVERKQHPNRHSRFSIHGRADGAAERYTYQNIWTLGGPPPGGDPPEGRPVGIS